MSAPSSLHCLCSFDNRLGGSVHAALNVCKYLADAGCGVQAIASYDAADDTGYLARDYPEVPCHTVARTFPRRICNAREMPVWLTDHEDDFSIVEVHGIFVRTTFIAARFCQQRGIPYFVRPHGQLDPFDLRKHRGAKRLVGPLQVRRLLERSAGVICTADLEAERLVTYGSRPVRHVIPLPVPESEGGGDGASFRRRHGISPDAKVVLFMSRIDYKKGLDHLIPALGELSQRSDDLCFVLAGTGDPAFMAKVRGWLAEHGVTPLTREVGFVTGADKRDALAAADVFALPSRNENFGIAVIEAMQASVPVLVSSEVYIWHEVAQGNAGVICEPTVPSVTQALGRMLDGSTDLAALGAQARATARRRFRPEASTERLVELYEATLRERRT